MKAMRLYGVCDLSRTDRPLRLDDIPVPEPAAGEILIRISTCGVCHTELDEIEGRTSPPSYPVIPGHQVVGRVTACGDGARRYRVDDRVGVAWIYSSCGWCAYCLAGRENLCLEFRATGRDVDGGYAEFMVVPETSAFEIPDVFSDTEAAPLLCAGAVGYRSLRLTNLTNGQTLGLTGFGASGHLVLQMSRYLFPDSRVVVFARSEKERAFARDLGAIWAGESTDRPPLLPDAIIDTTPVWGPVIDALENLSSGGRLVINAIRKEEDDKIRLMDLDYARHLWMEKEIKSVANIAPGDVREFLDLAASMALKPETQEIDLLDANHALTDLKRHQTCGAKVIRVN